MEVYRIAAGFVNYNVMFLILFAVITALVSLFAYRVYLWTKQEQLRTFSLAFFAFTIGYGLQVGGFYLLRGGSRKVMVFVKTVLSNSHAMFIVLGLLLLVMMALKVKDKKVMYLLFSVVLLSLAFSPRVLYLSHILSALLLSFIVWFYFGNFKKNKNVQSFIVLLAFVLLFLGHFFLIFSVTRGMFFTVGRLIDVAAYLLILLNLALTIKK